MLPSGTSATYSAWEGEYSVASGRISSRLVMAGTLPSGDDLDHPVDLVFVVAGVGREADRALAGGDHDPVFLEAPRRFARVAAGRNGREDGGTGSVRRADLPAAGSKPFPQPRDERRDPRADVLQPHFREKLEGRGEARSEEHTSELQS